MTPCSRCGSTDPRRIEGAPPEPSTVPLGTERAETNNRDFAAAGITEHGLRTLEELNSRLGPAELAPLHDAIDELRRYVGLLHTAAAGDASAINAFRQRALVTSRANGPLLIRGRQDGDPLIDGLQGVGRLRGGFRPGGLPSSEQFGSGRPFPTDNDGPCAIGGPHPFTFFSAGINASGVFNQTRGLAINRDLARDIGGMGEPSSAMETDGFEAAFTWIDRGFAGWRALASGIDGALGAGRRWLDQGEPRDFLGALRGPGSLGDLLPDRSIPSMCISEYQVCISEFVFTAMPLARTLYAESFPTLGSLSPTDQCLDSVGPISLFPPLGQQFPAQAEIQSGTFVAIDHSPVTIVSWTPQEIRLARPAGIAAGCHVVGWVHIFDSDAVNQIRGIVEQCRRFFGGNSLISAPYTIWKDEQDFSIIESPVIDTFHGPNGSLAPNAEACTPVLLTWATSVASCLGSRVQVAVTMLRDGQLYRTALPSDGQLMVTDETARTYTLRAQARIQNQQCGLATKSVTVGRFNELRVHAQGDTHCVDQGIGVSVDVTISCPAPAGGLLVTITSSDTTRVGNATGMIDEGTTTTSVEVLTGSQCGAATITIAVPNHASKKLTITVVSDPVIVSMTPTAFQTCDPIRVTINGSCLGESAADISALIDVNGQPLNGTVTILSAGTQIRLDFPALPAGVYPLAITQCSRVTYATLPIVVTTRLPSIGSLTSPTSVVTVCTTPTVSLTWSVNDVTHIILTRDGRQIADRVYAAPCPPVTDSVTDNLPRVTAGVSYVLTAFNADGAMTTKTLLIPPGSPVPVASAMVAINNSGSSRNVFIFDPTGAGVFIGTMSSGEQVSIPIPPCSARRLVSIDPATVARHNADFGDNLSPTSVQTADLGGYWRRTATGFFLGLNSATPIPVSV